MPPSLSGCPFISDGCNIVERAVVEAQPLSRGEPAFGGEECEVVGGGSLYWQDRNDEALHTPQTALGVSP